MISRKIQDNLQDDDQLRKHITEAKNELEDLWALQINESTDISNKAQLISFLQIIRGGKIISQFYFCCELKERITGDVFNLVNQNVILRGMQWQTCISVCTDSVPSMQG
uniref:DUF4371 domain-containing protein n=1 Tax=Octopus bimaculoides TaxID=37653 RepID=A0A0L8HIS2_OCTBM